MPTRLTKKRIRQVEQAVAWLAKYWGSYAKQAEFVRYSDETIIDDALYGLGVALWGNTFGSGYDETRHKLLEHLEKWRDERNVQRLEAVYGPVKKKAGV
jgi:hypothetical protein